MESKTQLYCKIPSQVWPQHSPGSLFEYEYQEHLLTDGQSHSGPISWPQPLLQNLLKLEIRQKNISSFPVIFQDFSWWVGRKIFFSIKNFPRDIRPNEYFALIIPQIFLFWCFWHQMVSWDTGNDAIFFFAQQTCVPQLCTAGFYMSVFNPLRIPLK